MNIFYLHDDPWECAKLMVDRHVVKMVLETSQLLSTAHRVLDGVEYIGKTKTGRNMKQWRLPDKRENYLYKATHINHPSSIWTRETFGNYIWLADHLKGLCEEYTHRYGKIHKVQSSGLFSRVMMPPKNIKSSSMTKPPCAMDTKYLVSDDPIENYRNYYIKGKSHLHKYTNRDMPDWLKENNIA